MEIAVFLLALISTIATVWQLFGRTETLLEDIRDLLREIRDDLRH